MVQSLLGLVPVLGFIISVGVVGSLAVWLIVAENKLPAVLTALLVVAAAAATLNLWLGIFIATITVIGLAVYILYKEHVSLPSRMC